jgi:uncharacterized protein (TIGR00369 family)
LSDPWGLEFIRRLGLDREAETGVYRTFRMRIVEAEAGRVRLEAEPNAEAAGFPTARGPILHGGVIATIADSALATAAGTVADEGMVPTTADLHVEFFRTGRPGPVSAQAEVRHRTRRLAYCSATVEQDGEPIAEARATIAFVPLTRGEAKSPH